MNMAKPDKKIVIIYHGNCPDGFGGAWAAWKKFKGNAEYIGAEHQAPPPDGLIGREIYIIDFSYPVEIIEKLLRENERVTAIDHHVSAEKSIKLTREYSYALDHSGAVLAWRYFYPEKKVPKLLEFVEDIDLWKFKRSGSRAVSAYLEVIGMDFRKWSGFARDLENPEKRKQIIRDGKLLLMYEEKLIARTLWHVEKVKFAGYKTLAVNSPNFSSEIGSALVKELPPLGIVWSERNGRIVVSLRSDGTANVSKIAARYGGGGHKAAAGFSFDAGRPFPWERLQK